MHLSILALLFALSAYAANDWTVPCFSGQCSYDLNTLASGAGGTMTLSGTSGAISDITEAADWAILTCDPNSMNQDIRIMCMDETTGGCAHLYENGARNTLVRLPESCGKMPFARLAREWVHEDQSVPNSTVFARRRDGSRPVIKGMTLDTNFAAIDPSVNGPISLDIVASNVPGVKSKVTTTPLGPQRRSRSAHHRRFQHHGFIDSIGSLLTSLSSFDDETTKDLPPVNINGTFNLFNTSLSCGAFDVAVDVNVIDADIQAIISLGVTAKGTIVPPKLDDFAIVTGLDADLRGTLDISTNAVGTINSGNITLFNVGIPGLDFPGILSVGPSFQLSAFASATLDVDVDLSLDFSYGVHNAKIFFPPQEMNSSAHVKPSQSKLQLSASPSVNSTATLDAHIIPTINLGIDALGVISANVFADVDASTTLTLDLAATKTPGTPPSFSGDVELDAGFSINVGADSSFLGLFDNSASTTVFSDNFQLFQKNFGNSPARSKRSPYLPAPGGQLTQRAPSKVNKVGCPGSLFPLPVRIT